MTATLLVQTKRKEVSERAFETWLIKYTVIASDENYTKFELTFNSISQVFYAGCEYTRFIWQE